MCDVKDDYLLNSQMAGYVYLIASWLSDVMVWQFSSCIIQSVKIKIRFNCSDILMIRH